MLLLERDLYLARTLFNIAMSPETNGNRVVAVVGLGHSKGSGFSLFFFVFADDMLLGIEAALRRWTANPSLINEECKDLTFVPATPWTVSKSFFFFLCFHFFWCAGSSNGCVVCVDCNSAGSDCFLWLANGLETNIWIKQLFFFIPTTNQILRLLV